MQKNKRNQNIEFDSLDKKTMESVDSFIKFTGIPVSYYDKDAVLKWGSHNKKNICTFCKAYDDKESLCRRNLKFSGNIAAQIGEQYIFLCQARLTLIAFPVVINDEHVGTFMAGPMIMGKLKNNMVEYVLNRSGDSKSQANVMIQLNEMQVFEPKTISAVASIFGSCIYSSINTNYQYENIRNSFKENQKVSEIIQISKKDPSGTESTYPMEEEKKLLEAVTSGDVRESVELIHKFMEMITIYNIGNIGLIKLDIIQMFGLLLRKIKEDMSIQGDTKDEYDFKLDKINKTTNIAELSEVVADLTEQIAVLFETGIYTGDVDIIKKTVNYISKHYMDKISLKIISESLHISTPYLSSLFKKEIGKTFSDFLTQYRIKKSESMLRETTISITEIALLSGFEDQSYFNKVFKKNTGKTPRQFRSQG